MTRIDDLNFYRDPRNAPAALEPIVLEHDGGTVEIPTCWVVCDVCDGRGTHTDPAIDCGGISADEFADDPEFAEAYYRGDYDQVCNRCRGRTTVRAPDVERMTPLMRQLYTEHLRECAEYAAEVEAELRAGA